MQLVSLPVASAGGREILLNPDQVVCVMALGDRRSQVVTTGLSAESSISIIVDLTVQEVGVRLGVRSNA